MWEDRLRLCIKMSAFRPEDKHKILGSPASSQLKKIFAFPLHLLWQIENVPLVKAGWDCCFNRTWSQRKLIKDAMLRTPNPNYLDHFNLTSTKQKNIFTSPLITSSQACEQIQQPHAVSALFVASYTYKEIWMDHRNSFSAAIISPKAVFGVKAYSAVCIFFFHVTSGHGSVW